LYRILSVLNCFLGGDMKTIQVPTYIIGLIVSEFLETEKGLRCLEMGRRIICDEEKEEIKRFKEVKKSFSIEWR
ncbi:MAG: hypothetical protein QW607_05575, partial [Desulfurococcaceae archaeon]